MILTSREKKYSQPEKNILHVMCLYFPPPVHCHRLRACLTIQWMESHTFRW